MANKLAEFSATLWRIAKFVLDATLTLLSSCLLLVALCVPWRLPFVILSFWKEKFEKLEDFQWFGASHFLLALLDVLALLSVLPSLVWPLRWYRTIQVIHKSWSDEDLDVIRTRCYSVELRVNLFLNAVSSYADVILLPFACIALLAFWRWTPFHTKSLQEALKEEDWCQRVSAVRNWAGWSGLNAILDLPFVLIGLTSVAVPTRLPAFLSVLLARGGDPEDPLEDCEARAFLFLLPFLSLADLTAGCFAIVAVVNPLRSAQTVRLLSGCWHEGRRVLGISQSFQRTARWNAELREKAVLIGLCSLMDVLILPLSLVVCATVYRARPLLAQICPNAQDGTREPSSPLPADGLEDATNLETESLPFSPLHQVACRQFALLVLDLFTLPSSLLVLLTWYRWKRLSCHMQRVRERHPNAAAVSYHLAVVANSFVVLHDALLFFCSLVLVVTVYRAKAAARALRNDPEPRVKLWQEIGHLLLDLPLLPLYLILLVTLWRADLVTSKVFKAENNCDRRSAVLWEFLELCRDVVGWLALAIVAVTLVRLPKALLDICAQRAQPVTGQPRLQLTRVRLRCPPDSATDRRLLIQAEGTQEGSRDRSEIGTIRINVISSRFWDEIGRLLGSGVASLGRALLPYTLADGKHLDYSSFLQPNASIDLRMGGKDMKSKLLQLDENMAMCVQIEHRDPTGKVEVLARLPIPMQPLQQAVRSPGETVEVAQELLTASPEVVCGPLLAGAGIRNALWLCALKELWQLCLDLAHLALFVLLALVPWRMLACAYYACAPSAVWLAVLSEQAVSLMRLRGAMLDRYRRGLEPALNAASKDPPKRTGDELRQVVAREVARTPLPSAGRPLVQELRRFGPRAESFVETLRSHSLLQDAVASYWPSLTLGANLQLAAQAFEPEEHALAILMIAEAQSSAQQLSATSLNKLQEQSSELRAAAKEEPGRCGLFAKPLSELRRLVQVFAVEGVKDYLTVLLGVLLLISVYRVPSVLRGIFLERQSELKHRVRAVLNSEVRLLVWDIWMLLSTVLATLLALVTLVRTIEFLQTALLHCSSLRDVRSAALEAVKEAACHWWELILLLTVWNTYKTLVHAAVCAVLLPAYSLEVGPFALRIVLWIGLCALPWTTIPFQYVLLIFLLVVLGCFGAARGLPCRSRGEQTASQPLRMRMTGMNFVVLLSILAEAALLSSVSYLRFTLQEDALFPAAAVAVGFWLLSLALPHTQPEGLAGQEESSENPCLRSAKFQAAVQLLRRWAVLPAATVLLAHCAGQLGHWSLALLAFLAFTTALGSDMHAHFQSFLSETLGLDLVQPPAFLAGLMLAQLIFLAQVLCLQPAQPWALLLTSALLPSWVLNFHCLQGLGGPPWLLPLQLGASLAPGWSQLAIALGLETWAQLAGFGALALLSAAGMLVADGRARRRQQKMMKEAGVPQMIEELAQRLNAKEVLLARSASAESGRALPRLGGDESSQGLAGTLEAYEAAVRTERLSAGFLEARKEWLAELRAGRDDYGVVARCGNRLAEAVSAPCSMEQTMCMLRRHAARRLPRDIWKMIMTYVADVDATSRLLEPVVKHFGAGGPQEQVVRGWRAMSSIGRWLTRQRKADRSESSESLEDALNQYLREWWQDAPRHYGRSVRPPKRRGLQRRSSGEAQQEELDGWLPGPRSLKLGCPPADGP